MMISVAQAQQLLLRYLPKFNSERQAASTVNVSLMQAQRQVIGEDIVAERDQPPFNRVAMDGIAIAFSSFNSGQRSFKISAMQRAGEPEKTLDDTQACIEIMTGAPLPKLADTIVRYEDLITDNGVAHIKDNVIIKRGQNIHAQGDDCKKGDTLLTKGCLLHAPQIGMLASNGYHHVHIKTQPKIALVTTGDELVALDQPVQDHQIRQSNGYAMATLLRDYGFQDCDIFHVADNQEQMFATFQNLVITHDVIISCGGVSAGKFDFLPTMFKDLGITEVFHKIAQRPGKPMWFGYNANGVCVYGLPGNPASALVNLRRYIIPVLKNAFFQAISLPFRPTCLVQLTEEMTFNKPLTQFVPVSIHIESNALLMATPVAFHGSGDFTNLASSDGFIELPAELAVFAKGANFHFYSWHHNSRPGQVVG